MRRSALAVTAAMGTVLLAATLASPAWADPIPVPSPVPGTAVCTVDNQLSGITGLVATANGGYAVAVKGTASINVKVYLLDGECRRTGRTLAYTADRGARDPQDIQVTADGTYWVADTGDDPINPGRTNVGVWKLAPDGRATLFRFSYPDRAQSAQALLMSGNGTPVIITDNPKGAAGIYVPSGPLDPAGRAVQLKHVGDFTPQDTGTENKLGKIGMTRVTGGANSADGKHVAIRTFSDAYEWSVTNGDVVGALTAGTPKITPLPNEPQGSAIAYTRDGTSFLTVSDLNHQDGIAVQMLKYKASPPVTAAKPPRAAPGIAAKGDTRSWFGRLGLQDLLRIVGAVGVVGLVMVLAGVIGIRRARRRAVEARRRPVLDEDPQVLNGPTAALAEVPGGRRPDRYGYGEPGFGAPGPYPPEPVGYGPGPEAVDRYPGPEAVDRYPGATPDRGRARVSGPTGPGGVPPGTAAPPGMAPPAARRPDRGVARPQWPGSRDDDAGRRGYPDPFDSFGNRLD